jgi:hypothetical protein
MNNNIIQTNIQINDYENLYINICTKETVDLINCIYSEPNKCDREKLLYLFLKCNNQTNKHNNIKKN